MKWRLIRQIRIFLNPKCMVMKSVEMSMKNFDELRDKAMQIATEVHKTQVDKGGKPYIGHPLRVEKLCNDDDSKIVALLHDTIEDGDITAEYLLMQGFPTYIVDAVLSVSRNKGEDYFEGGSINYHRKVLSCQSFYVLSSCGLFLVQFACSFSRIARYTPSFTNKLTSKIVSQSVKANL